MNINPNKGITKWIRGLVQHYNHEYYWRIRNIVTDRNSKTPKLIKLYYLYKIKKNQITNNASLGTDLNGGAVFKSSPRLIHGLNGIIIGHDVTIGKNCTIFQQVTVADGGKITIGDNCLLGAGAKILGNVKIGDNCSIGANAVVVHDIPNNSVAVGVPAKVVKTRI